MNITDRQNELEFGDVILIRNRMTSPIGFLIQCFLGSYYSHLAIYYGSGKIIEAVPIGGVKISDLSDYDDHKFCILRIIPPISGTIFEGSLKQWTDGQIGKGYDYMAFLYMFLSFLFARLRFISKEWRKDPGPWDDPARFFCFQFGAEAFRPFNIINVDYRNAIDTDFLNSTKMKKI